LLYGAQMFDFSFPKVFYEFLDGLSPKQSLRISLLLKELLKNTTAELVLYSIVKRLRALILIKEGQDFEHSETSKMAPWQLSKLKKQADNWSLEKLLKYYTEFAKLDEAIKTSSLSLPLAQYLDILVLTDLN